jgi:hypothetical protein
MDLKLGPRGGNQKKLDGKALKSQDKPCSLNLFMTMMKAARL